MPSALSHIRVLDLSRILAGPWASQMLADLGADVIKVERPKVGDDTRQWGPPWLTDSDGCATEESAYFTCANRGKRSMTVDITTTDGQAIIRDLVAKSDVLLENYKVDGLKKYGLDYQSLQLINPQLIYCSITGFGQTGPLKHRAGYDFMIQAMGGLMSVTGQPEGQPGAGPQKVGVALADIMTGLYASNACMAALIRREQSGVGQHIDLALLDVQVATLANQASNYLASDTVPKRLGNAHPNIVPYQSFATADGHFILAVGNDSQFARLAELLGHSEWASDGLYRSNAQRVRLRCELVPLLEPCFKQHSTEHWIDALEKVGVPCGPINSIDQVFANEQVIARGMQQSAMHPTIGEVGLVANPIKLSESPVLEAKAPPMLGEHSIEILRDVLSLDAAECERLILKGIV